MWSVASIIDLAPFVAVERMLADVNRCERNENGVLVDPIVRLDR
jgi:hypothetical protein